MKNKNNKNRATARNTDPVTDKKFVLLTQNDNSSAHYVIFPKLIQGTPINVNTPNTNHNTIKTNLRRIIRPFVGRAQDIIKLISNITQSKFSVATQKYMDK